MPIFRGNPELLRRFREGDRDALETVYRAYVGKIENIVRFGFRLPDGGGIVGGIGWQPAEIVDAIQEVFAKGFATAARAGFDGARDYGPYLYAITRNVLADRLRRTHRELPTPWQELERLREGELVPHEEPAAWADEATVAVVRAYLGGLDEQLRRIHQARYVEGLSQRDAAERLGISRQTLRTLEARLRDGLRRELEKPD
jgi:RNA polymerase sigma-70 factor (ECF subfamily)